MKTILIVEDDRILQGMYKDKFEMSEFFVIAASDGVSGLQMALKERPDLLLLDLALPKMQGIALLEKLRDDEWGKKLPVIVFTNLNVDGELLEKINKFSPVYCLLKANVTPEEILTKAKEVLVN